MTYFLYLFYAILLIFSGYYVVFICVHAWGIKKTTYIKKSISIQGVSILIPVRNEAHQISRLLACLLSQKNIHFPIQIILIDDHSEDDLYTSIQSYLDKIDYIVLPADKQGKKQAIEHGIAHAKYEIILTTDADCTMNEQWLYTLLSCFDHNTQLVSAPVFLKANTFFEKMQQIELMGLVGIGAGAIYLNKPNLCNGANLAYRKTAFISVGGYEGSTHLASGDDELLMHKIHAHYKNSDSIRFCKHSDAIVYTLAQATLKQFLQQRKRWISKAKHYQRKGLTTQLVFIYGYYLILWISLFLSLSFFEFRYSFITAWTLKILAEYSIILQMLVFFKQNLFKNTLIFVGSQFFQMIYVLWAGIVSLRPNFTWKNRKYA